MEARNPPCHTYLSCMADHVRGPASVAKHDAPRAAESHRCLHHKGELQGCSSTLLHHLLVVDIRSQRLLLLKLAIACGVGGKHQMRVGISQYQLRFSRLRSHAAPKHNPQNVPDPVVIQPANPPHDHSPMGFKSAVCGNTTPDRHDAIWTTCLFDPGTNSVTQKPGLTCTRVWQ